MAGGRGQRGRWHAWDGRWQVAGTSVAGSMHGMAGGRLQGPAWQVACMGWQVWGSRCVVQVAGGKCEVAGVGWQV